MLPTQPNNFGRGWWQPPDMQYNFNHRFAWPAPPAEVAAGAAAAPGVGAGTGAAAAEGAAAHFAHGAGAGGSAGGMPPRGPWGYRNYYHDAYHYRRGWGRRPVFKRFIWFGLGVWVGAAWIKSHHKKEDDVDRLIRAFAPAQPQGSTATSAPLVDHTSPEPIKPLSNESRRWGWGCHDEREREHRWGWRYRQELQRKKEQERQMQEQMRSDEKARSQTEINNVSNLPTASAAPIPSPSPSAQSVFTTAPAPATSTTAAENTVDGGEMIKLRETVERLWEEKKKDAMKAQESANDKAKEYAREKLDKLSAALETLRESLKQDATNKSSEEKKLV